MQFSSTRDEMSIEQYSPVNYHKPTYSVENKAFKETLIKIANLHCPCGCTFEARDILKSFDKNFKLETDKYD